MTDHPAVLVRRPGRRPDVLDGFTPNQGDKARLLLADGALVPARHPRCFWVVSSDGERSYLVHPAGCTCPAGLHERLCYHRAAVMLALAGGSDPAALERAARRHWAAARRLQGDKAQAARELAQASRAYARRLRSVA